MRKALLMAALAMLAVTSASAQSERKFPSAAEITLLSEQVAKALDKFEPLLKRQFYANSEQKNRQVKEVGELRTYIETMEAEPQKFNGILGFVFVETLHDVDGFAEGCAQVSLAGRDLELTNACQGAALSMTDAINRAQDLYARYIKAVSEKNCVQGQPARPIQ